MWIRELSNLTSTFSLNQKASSARKYLLHRCQLLQLFIMSSNFTKFLFIQFKKISGNNGRITGYNLKTLFSTKMCKYNIGTRHCHNFCKTRHKNDQNNSRKFAWNSSSGLAVSGICTAACLYHYFTTWQMPSARNIIPHVEAKSNVPSLNFLADVVEEVAPAVVSIEAMVTG